ncbi:MAG: hypothetical protein MJ209_01390 [archaeon]|nr:hypothetical protein [archaeon]
MQTIKVLSSGVLTVVGSLNNTTYDNLNNNASANMTVEDAEEEPGASGIQMLPTGNPLFVLFLLLVVIPLRFRKKE